jgi:hypothetical protein
MPDDARTPTPADNRRFRGADRCFSLGSTFIDLPAKVDSFPPADVTRTLQPLLHPDTADRHRKNASLNVDKFWDS